MASLQSSCLVLATNSKPPKASSSGTARRFHVSCSSGGGGGAGGGVDRRNMLLGMGGLYGAAAANLKARADPIKLQDIRPCGVPSEGDPIDENCCPPFSDGIHSYKLPPVKRLRVRPAAHKLHPDHLAKFEEAIRRMKELDETKPNDPRGFRQQANVHCAYCDGVYDQVGYRPPQIFIHSSWLFFPWHRWYLYFYERILGKLIDDPTFALPFWNWDHPDGMQLPAIFDDPDSPLYDAKRNASHLPPACVDLQYADKDYDCEILVKNNLATMHKQMVTGVRQPEDFMGQSYVAGNRKPASARAGTLEHGPHNSVHRWVGDPSSKGEDMGYFYSAGRDPVFYSHHANVDRMWTIWKSLETPVQKDIDDQDYLNASFLFYDENKELVRVRVGDALDNQKMGYEYEKVDIPWIDYKPPMRVAGVKIRNLSQRAERPEKVFPLTLDKTTRVLVSKTRPGKADEKLVLEDVHIHVDDFVKFDVYVNNEEDEPEYVDTAEYAGTFSKLPHGRGHHSLEGKGSINFYLKELYENIQINDDDDEVVVTIVPRANGRHVIIDGIKIVEV